MVVSQARAEAEKNELGIVGQSSFNRLAMLFLFSFCESAFLHERISIISLHTMRADRCVHRKKGPNSEWNATL